MATVSESPLDWPEERPDLPEPSAPYRRGATVWSVEDLTAEEVAQIEARRARHAAEDAAAEIVAATPRRRRVSALAIAAIVFAFALPFVGVLLGLIGTVRLDSRSPTSGRGLSIAAIVISVLEIAFFAWLLGA